MLRTIRERRGLTREELAEMVGSNVYAIGRLERGQTEMKESWLNKLSKALVCDKAELLGLRAGNNSDMILSAIRILNNYLYENDLRLDGERSAVLVQHLLEEFEDISTMEADGPRVIKSALVFST